MSDPASPGSRARAVGAVVGLVVVLTVSLLGAPAVEAAPGDTAASVGAVVDPTDPATEEAEPDEEPEDPEDPEDPVPGDLAEEGAEDPLTVLIDRVAPSVLPTSGDLRVAGRIRNDSATDWTDLRAYLLTSTTPMTTVEELTEAAQSDPRLEVGDRLIEPGLYTRVGDLAPGESTRYRLSVPRSALAVSGDPGVYWLGVQVLGTTEGERLEGADGRARTFLPAGPEPGTEDAGSPTSLALGIQLRNRVVRLPDGRLRNPEGWLDLVSPGGRLERLVELGRSSRRTPMTWVVDPAVLDAARSAGAGNPPVLLAEPERVAVEELAPPVRRWFRRLLGGLEQGTLLTVPYGDVDLSGAVRASSEDLVDTAVRLSSARMDELGLLSRAVAFPRAGSLSPEAVALMEDRMPLVLEQDAVAGPPAFRLLDPRNAEEVLLTPAEGGLWGPGPGDRRSALAVRQRILADAAVHALSDEADVPLVRFLPSQWDPGPAWERAAFLRGLDVPWLRSVGVLDLLESGGPDAGVEVEDWRPVWTEADAERALKPSVLAAASALASQGRVLSELLVEDVGLEERVTSQALHTASVWSRGRPGRAISRARAAREALLATLDGVAVRSPAFVTMSSETGTFQVTVVNNLDQTILVGLGARVGGEDLTVRLPGPVEIPPNSRSALRVDLITADIGVHAVTLQPETTDGTPLGTATRVSVRSTRVGLFLWIVMGVGAAALFGTISLRLVRRVRTRRRTHGPVLVKENR